jgi:type I restriction enzyme M protein
MVAVLRPRGRVATVMPHGVLFRGGAEQEIRESLLRQDLLEAVIGLPPNLFYGTSIPACILVLRAPRSKPEEREGQVLFINADAEYYEGRAQNFLRPEHIEKIVTTYREFHDVPRYARVVDIAELEENDFNLNIRRYADNAPPPEPHDVRAHLRGGVPKGEIVARRALFEAVGLSPNALFDPEAGAKGYAAFRADLDGRSAIQARIEEDSDTRAQLETLDGAFARWWSAARDRLARLAPSAGGDGRGRRDLISVRDELIGTFEAAILPVGLLDRFQVTGVVAAWWDAIDFDLRTLANQGFAGLIDSWVASIRAAEEDGDTGSGRNGDDPLAHPLVEQLLPGYLERLDALAAREADLKAQIAEGKRLQEDDAQDELGLADEDEVPTDEELTELRREKRAARKEHRALQKDFLERLAAAHDEVAGAEARRLVLEIERERLAAELARYATAKQQALVEAVEVLWDKYHVSLRELEAARDAAVARLEGFVEELGYGG